MSQGTRPTRVIRILEQRNLDQEAEIEIDMGQEEDDSDYADDGSEFESE